MMKWITLLLLVLTIPLWGQEKVDEAANKVLRKYGMEQSRVMEIASWITDVYGPRLTGSVMLDKATDWALKTLKDWGLENVHTEDWGPFGRGWELKHFEMHAEAPGYFPVLAYPKAWSPSTKGLVKGEVVYLEASTEEDLEKYKGKLGGKFVLFDTLRVVKEATEAQSTRYEASDLLDMANSGQPVPRNYRGRWGGGNGFNKKLWQLLGEEKPLAIIDCGFRGDLGTIFLSGARAIEGRAWEDTARVIPQIAMEVEHYNRIFRVLKKGMPVKMSMEIDATYSNPDKGMERNIIAEIPGTDLKDEVVMFGAHYDSWHSATGATDNGAGSAVMLEVARILKEMVKETGIQPRRTLRLALWTGEEQGLLGSRAYAKEHYADGDNYKPEQEKISAYYNLDNGTGKVRGVYMQGNGAVASIFRPWLDAFKDLDATTLTLQNTGGTDHLSFDGMGIPGFQFIQDPMAYFSRTHHTNMDNYDHLSEEDLKQAATIIASFVWQTAQRDEKIPRKPMAPKESTNN